MEDVYIDKMRPNAYNIFRKLVSHIERKVFEMTGYMTIKEAAKKWGVSVRWVQTLCSQDNIDGALKFGAQWAIPEDTEKPRDGRVKSGRYKNWRNKAADNEE